MAKTGRKFFQGNAFALSMIALSVILLNIIVFLIWNPFKIRSYKGMKEIEVKEVFSIAKKKEITSYYVYFYKSNGSCPACNEAESFVVAYAETARTNKTLKPIFIIDVLKEGNERFIAEEGGSSNLTNVNNYRDIKVLYTPTLILVQNGKITNAYESKTTILKQLETEKNKVTNTSFSTLAPDLMNFRRKEHAFN